MIRFDLDRFWNEESDEHREVIQATSQTLKTRFESLLDICAASLHEGGKILLFGNGGSAADAQHIATELTIRYKKDRAPIAALALTTDTSALTAAGNDLGFDQIFARQLDALGRPGDVAIGLSTSGRSPNVLEALKTARAKKLKTAGFSGAGGGDMSALCDVLLDVPSTTTARIQEMHILLGHMLCGALERILEMDPPETKHL
ncbi:MAG: D-sedoheptulose 7-phosphate isomerase [Alphaproteobacteria bacterium]|nr:D-sedoheptulose 7-phosphate isomerase [Alphaproteobacteria bacterium]